MSSEDFTGDAENQAIYSAIAGVAAMIFAIFGQGTILWWGGVIAGALAVASGVRGLQGAEKHRKLAATGAITGTIAIAFWLLCLVAQAIAAVVRWF